MTMETIHKDHRPVADRLMFLLAAISVILSVIIAARLVLSTRTGTVDSYYYFARAADLNDGVPLSKTSINWGEEGVDRKFFPGYPLLLHWLSLGSPPERVWRTFSVLFMALNPILLGFAFRRVGLSFFASCAAVAMFVSHPIPMKWLTMPMAEGGALFYLSLAAISLPLLEDKIKIAYPRFLISCIFGGMAILCRAEASFVAACIGLLGLSRFYKKPGWLVIAAAGAILGVVPFGYWVSSLPPAASGSRLHYINEFMEMFSWRDIVNDDQSRGGVIDNFGRSWYHVIFNWGRIPFMRTTPESSVLLAIWMVLFGIAILMAAADLLGKLAQRCAIAFIGFIIFRSFWYYPYDRFLVTGLPMAFAAMALGADYLKNRGGWFSVLGVMLVVCWTARSTENYLQYHKYARIPENGTHTYRDDTELIRLQFQMDYTWFPAEGGDMGVMAARRFSKKFDRSPENAAKDAVAVEFNWPQVNYGLRPRHVVVGYPFVNFWGDAEYRKRETVPVGPDGNPVRRPRRSLEFLNAKNVRYILTRLPRTLGEARDSKDREFGTWVEAKGIDPDQIPFVFTIDTFDERLEVRTRNGAEVYEWPRWVRVLEMRVPENYVFRSDDATETKPK